MYNYTFNVYTRLTHTIYIYINKQLRNRLETLSLMPIVVFRRLRSFVWKFHFIIDNWSICFSVNLANLWNKIIFTNLSFPFKWIWVIKKWLLQYTDTNKCVYKYINVYIYIYIYIYHTHTHVNFCFGHCAFQSSSCACWSRWP